MDDANPNAYTRASELRRRGRPQEAIPLLEGFLETAPGDVAARYALAVCLTDLGRTAEAAAQLLRVLDRMPGHYEAAYRLGRVLQADGDRAGAADAYRRVLEVTEFRDARERLRECEEPVAGEPGSEVPPPLRSLVDDRRVVDRGRLVAPLRLKARHLIPGTLGKALLAAAAAVPVSSVYAGGESAPLAALLAVALFGGPKIAAGLLLLAVAAGIASGVIDWPVIMYGNLRLGVDWPAPSLLLVAVVTTAALVIVIVGIPAALLNSRINGSDVYEYGVEIRRGLIRRTVQFIWYYQIVEAPSYRRTFGTYFTHTASLGIRYNDNGASSVTHIEMSGVGTPARVREIGRYLESRIPAERLPIRGPWT
ncbi:tetratricopeptide repeat protein [Herbidospora sp. NBRC 101105]|uniref:tetratricopeptide repeat protein n=1 Tax=Herbidospora sp. NBRC 101105 TaxID=3032195 RepID=UPI002556CCFB|nr:tetratricopeptide repeat protein [Herbidospora sp. NBRC 101105]